MWVLPKTLESKCFESDTRTQELLCAEKLLVRGSGSTVRMWKAYKKNVLWSSFIFEHIHISFEPHTFEPTLCGLKKDTCKVNSKNKVCENTWGDLPLFQNINSFSFCSKSSIQWDAWVALQRHRLVLRTQIKYTLWATPTVRDHLDANINAPLPLRKDGKGRMDGVARQALHISNYAGSLNPRWLEPLMGVRVGWVKPCFRKRSHT